MGYTGKIVERQRARELRAQGWTYSEIEAELGVSRSSVSLWVSDVAVDDIEWARRVRRNKNFGARSRPPNRLQVLKQTGIDRCRAEGVAAVGELTDRDLFVAGIALYAGEGFKTGGSVGLANTDPRMIGLFLAWFRRFFDVDESRLRVRLYLHEGLDLDAANRFWSELAAIPLAQFTMPYRAKDDPTRRRAKHPLGCPTIRYHSALTLRAVLGQVDALLHSPVPVPG